LSVKYWPLSSAADPPRSEPWQLRLAPLLTLNRLGFYADFLLASPYRHQMNRAQSLEPSIDKLSGHPE
jgi:hypothetical protein